VIKLPEEIDGYTLVDGRYEPIEGVAQRDLNMVYETLVAEIVEPVDPPFGNPYYVDEYLVDRARVIYATKTGARAKIEHEYGRSITELRTAFQSSEEDKELYRQITSKGGNSYADAWVVL
jgi:hypothetical protein